MVFWPGTPVDTVGHLEAAISEVGLSRTVRHSKKLGSKMVLDSVKGTSGHRSPHAVLAEKPVPENDGNVQVNQEK